MFRREPLKESLRGVGDVLDWPAAQTHAVVPLVRAALRHGGVLAVSRAGQQVVVSVGGIPPGGLFELASVTKPFTAALAGVLVQQRQLEWDIPLATLGQPFRGLPSGITPRRLATHTAGLPSHPARAALTTLTRFYDPYGSLKPSDVLASARRWARSSQPAPFVYSNLGVGLLALALAYAAGQEMTAAGYGRALERYITRPLELGVTLYPAQVVAPYGVLGSQQLTGFGELAGAGGLFGTAADLLRFGQAHLQGRLGEYWQQAQQPPGLPLARTAVAPGWFYSAGAIWHDGVARGTRTALGFCPATDTVAVVLARGGLSLTRSVGVQAVPELLLGLLAARPGLLAR